MSHAAPPRCEPMLRAAHATNAAAPACSARAEFIAHRAAVSTPFDHARAGPVDRTLTVRRVPRMNHAGTIARMNTAAITMNPS